MRLNIAAHGGVLEPSAARIIPSQSASEKALSYKVVIQKNRAGGLFWGLVGTRVYYA